MTEHISNTNRFKDAGFKLVENVDDPSRQQYPESAIQIAKEYIKMLPLAKRAAAMDLLNRNEMRLLHTYIMEELPR